MGNMDMVRFGVDLGGTKTEIVALDGDGREILRRRRPTPRGDYQAIVAGIAALIGEAERTLARTGSVGVGIPGTISPATGLVKNANTTELIGHALDKDIAAATGRQVRLANDADCFALSEAVDGAWPRDDERPGPRCYCGREGCVETFLSGPAFARDHARHAGGTLSAAEIAAAAAAGDDAARASVERYAGRLARALATVINIFDPEVVVLGGGMSRVEALYTRVPALWGGAIFSDSVATRLLPPVHGDSSGVRGAAWLWPP
jgi:fructokinase